MRVRRPYAYQVVNGKRVQVACDYRLDERTATLRLARYDRTRTLVVDPNIGCSTYVGGSDDDAASGISIGPSGDVYVTGSTESTDFPATAGAYADYASGDSDVFVARMSQDARLMRWCTYIGGNRHDHGVGLAVDAAGAATVAGSAWSADFPTTAGAFQLHHAGGTSDVFALRLAATGDALAWSTYIGASSNEYGSSLALLDDGSVVVTGGTESANYPVTAGAHDSTYGGNWDAYVTKLDPTGHALVFSSFLGGWNSDEGIAIAPVGDGLYVCGRTYSSDFPTTCGAFDTAYADRNDGFVAKLASDGASLPACTYLGGAGDDIAWAVGTDSAGYVYVAGETASSDFPTTPGAWDRTLGSGDAFVTKFDASLAYPVYSTLVGGSIGDTAYALLVGPYGNATIAGFSHSTNFPVTADAIDSSYGGNGDAFLTKLTASGGGLVFSTYLGGANNEHAHAAVLAEDGDVYLAGHSRSTDFPTSTTAFDRSFNGGSGDGDAFVAGIMFTTEATQMVASAASGQIGQTVSLTATLSKAAGGALPGKTVRFFIYATDVGSAITNASGVASKSHKIPETWGTGPKTLTARFDGDDPYWPSSDTDTLTISKGDTVVVASPSSGAAGSAATLEAALTRVSDGAALQDRPVRFLVEGTFVGEDDTDGLGRAGLDYLIPSGTDPGIIPYSAEFVGDATYFPSADGDDIAVSVGTDLVPDNVTGQIGQTVQLSAHLARSDNGLPVAGQSVNFLVEGSAAGSDDTDALGIASAPYALAESIGPGVWRLDATYEGECGFGPSSGIADLTILAANTSLYTIDRTGTITGLVILRQFDLKRLSDNAMLEGKTILFKIDGTEVGTAFTNAGGDSTLNWIITNGPATRTITAWFAGDAAYNGCSDDAVLTAQTHAAKMSGVNREGKITAYRILKAWLYRLNNTPVVGKAISFKLDGTLLGTDPTRSTGLAQIGYTIADGTGAGGRTILAEWSGDGGYLPSSCTNTLTVVKATPYIWVMPRSVPQGGVARMYAYFRRLADYQKQEGKTVSFKVDGTWIADVVTLSGAEAGIARYQYATVEPPGVHTMRCEFAGDAWVDAGYGEATLTIY